MISCKNTSTPVSDTNTDTTRSTLVKQDTVGTVAEPSTLPNANIILSRKQVPILCYHHIKEVDELPKSSIGYTVTYNTFMDHIKSLADSGYHTITPDQLYNYLVRGTSLPENPVMITFDDTDVEQFILGKKELDKYGFKGVFFIMTIALNKPRYMNEAQLKQLSDEGHVIACHTWDHSRTDRYVIGDRMIQVGNKEKPFNDWDVQLTQTKNKLENITGKKVAYFAYPFGVWNAAGIPEIKKRGFKLAFQLASKRDPVDPLYTVRRIIVAPSWKGTGLLRAMRISFK